MLKIHLSNRWRRVVAMALAVLMVFATVQTTNVFVFADTQETEMQEIVNAAGNNEMEENTNGGGYGSNN
ncbi:MAG: hypothetical protein J6A42_00685 [Firmicutes bacterium]|nr:hypothetical protein [Bacillota bacterium]